MNYLEQAKNELTDEIVKIRGRVQEKRKSQTPVALTSYALAGLEDQLNTELGKVLDMDDLTVQISLLERAKFGGDLAIKFPQLLQKGGPKRFIAEFQPAIVERLNQDDFAAIFDAIETKGMYINVTLSNRWLLDSAQSVINMGDQFALNDALSDKTHVVDYSSPNVAKVLHAGHIRSTIVGHVLSNLLDACGATVYRVNHINDFGGFGFLLEGVRRFKDNFPEGFSENEKLLEIYKIRRTMEKLTQSDREASDWSSDEKDITTRYFGGCDSLAAAKDGFADYTLHSDNRFAALEQGDQEEVSLWQDMVKISLADFQTFYDALNINIDFVIGESYYYQGGDDTVNAALEAGTAIVFSQDHADELIAGVNAQLEKGDIEKANAEVLIQAIEKDIGAVVIPLENGQRCVVRRSDGRSIYTTRDIGAIKQRNDLFDPDHVSYVVGQEQRVHFERLFDAASQIGLVKDGKPSFNHLYFGFYVDSETGKKLSSRDTVSGVLSLLKESKDYFLNRLSDRGNKTPEECNHAAQELTIGSLVFNDLKQDLKGSVDIDAQDMLQTIQGFEKSGGAYVVYSACRARSILRKYGKDPIPASEISEIEIDDQEAQLLLKIQQIPLRLIEAVNKDNPSILIRHLIEIATVYNSYYMRAPVITDGVADPVRLLITKALQVALTNGLAICHINCPEEI